MGIALAIVVAIILAGFIVTIPVSSTSSIPLMAPQTTLVSVSQQTNATSSVFVVSATLQPGTYVDSPALLTVGSDVKITYGADNNLDVYVFNSSQFGNYASDGTTMPNILAQSGNGSGTIGFRVYSSDTYYLVFHDPFSVKIGVSSSGTATYSTATAYTTQTCISTEYSTSTKSCSDNLWAWLSGSRSCS